jgi:protein TonB
VTASSDKKLQIQAWGISVATHSVVVGMAVVFMAQIQPIPMKDVFQWEVSLVEPVQQEATAEPEKPVPSSPASKPQAEATAKAAPVSQVMTRQVETVEKPAVVQRAVQQVVETAKLIEQTVKPIEQTIAAQRPEPVTSEQSVIKQTQPQERAAEGSLPAVTTQAPVVTTSAQSVIAQAPVVASIPANETATVMTPAIRTQSEVTPWQTIGDSSPTVAGAEAPKVQEQQIASVTAPSASAVVAQAPVQVAKAVPQTSDVRTDYRWIGESLWRRVAELKRYPNSARLHGLEGRVVLKVVIRADGHLAGVSVITSSGHAVLDDAAVEAVKLACPLHMKHELGKPQIVVSLPIVFSLAN